MTDATGTREGLAAVALSAVVGRWFRKRHGKFTHARERLYEAFRKRSDSGGGRHVKRTKN